jgi:hypothetical protein
MKQWPNYLHFPVPLPFLARDHRREHQLKKWKKEEQQYNLQEKK